MADYKTVADASEKGVIRNVVKYGIHRQGAFYCDGSKRKTFWIIAQEKKPPYAVHTFLCHDDFLFWGRARYRATLAEIKKVRDEYGPEWGEKKWPGYGWRSHGATSLMLPDYEIKRMTAEGAF